MPKDGQVDFPEPGNNAFQNGPLDNAWMSRLVRLVLRQILIKGVPVDCPVRISEENIVFDLTNLNLQGTLRMTILANGAPTDINVNASLAEDLPA